MISTWGNQKKGLCRFSARFLAFSDEISNQINSNLSLYSLDYAEACNELELAGLISASLRPGNTAPFRRNVAAVARRWQHCVRFDRPEIWTSDLPLAKFFFLPWFCRFITSHPVSQPSVSYSALNFDLIRSIHRQLGTMVLGKVRLLLSSGKISLAVVEQAWKNITKHKQLVNKLTLTFHDQVKILRQNFWY